jgi:hypothetical protein
MGCGGTDPPDSEHCNPTFVVITHRHLALIESWFVHAERGSEIRRRSMNGIAGAWGKADAVFSNHLTGSRF